MNLKKLSWMDQLRPFLAVGLLAALTGCTTYVDQRPVVSSPPPVYVPPPPEEPAFDSAEFVVRSEADFYEPLSPYGHWEVIGVYGRCWVPARVEADWRPYCHGNWERTEAGWYWASDEPWGWATYHYGRWDFSPRWGWYWVPQTQWAPAWVSWHEGGGYVGWAPLPPSVRAPSGGPVVVNVAAIPPRAFVFVEPRSFLRPVRPTTVVVNNTTIIKKTVNITNIKVVNNTVINEGPRTQVIEQASGEKVRVVRARELRKGQETEVVARRGREPGREKREGTVQAPVRTETAPGETKPDVGAQREAEARARSEKAAQELENRNRMESERRAKEAAAKAEAEARAKQAAETREAARMKAKEAAAQAEAQKTARELENKNRIESE